MEDATLRERENLMQGPRWQCKANGNSPAQDGQLRTKTPSTVIGLDAHYRSTVHTAAAAVVGNVLAVDIGLAVDIDLAVDIGLAVDTDLPVSMYSSRAAQPVTPIAVLALIVVVVDPNHHIETVHDLESVDVGQAYPSADLD